MISLLLSPPALAPSTASWSPRLLLLLPPLPPPQPLQRRLLLPPSPPRPPTLLVQPHRPQPWLVEQPSQRPVISPQPLPLGRAPTTVPWSLPLRRWPARCLPPMLASPPQPPPPPAQPHHPQPRPFQQLSGLLSPLPRPLLIWHAPSPALAWRHRLPLLFELLHLLPAPPRLPSSRPVLRQLRFRLLLPPRQQLLLLSPPLPLPQHSPLQLPPHRRLSLLHQQPFELSPPQPRLPLQLGSLPRLLLVHQQLFLLRCLQPFPLQPPVLLQALSPSQKPSKPVQHLPSPLFSLLKPRHPPPHRHRHQIACCQQHPE